MKKEFLIVLSVVLVVVIVACGLWLGYYAVDSQHQKQTYETLAEDFLLEEPESSLSLAENDSPEQSSTTQETVVTLTTAPPRHDLAALQAENPDCVGWLTFPDTTVDYPVVWTPSDPGALPAPGLLRQFRQWWHALPRRRTKRRQRDRTLLYTATICWTAPMFKPIVQCLEPSFRQTHQDIYLELNSTQYHYQVIVALETNTRSPVYTYTDLNNTAEMEDFRACCWRKPAWEPSPRQRAI